MILVIDNYDSFTWTIVDYLRALGTPVKVVRNDAMTATEALASEAQGYLISPGPGGPEDAGISLDLVAACAVARRPLLGICLGHQAIGQHFGSAVVRLPPVHGKTSAVTHDGSGVFDGIPSPFEGTRYHSLAVAARGLPECLYANAMAGDALMGVRHRTLPIHGVQFHPESVASEHGHLLLANFVRLATECGRY